MQSTDAAKWFWPFMLVAAIAAATIIALPPSAPKAAADEPEFRMLVKVSAQLPRVSEANLVTIEPSYIQVTAKRPVSFAERLAGVLQRRHST